MPDYTLVPVDYQPDFGDYTLVPVGGVYGHTLTFSEPGSNNLATFTHADPTGLLVATPDENDPSSLRVREYKGY